VNPADKARLLQRDLEYYSRLCLKIRTKAGTIEPFIFNRAQRFIHDKLEAQLEAQGKVRALILKGRQQGCSTYVSARYYHQATQGEGKGLRVFILTHEDAATQNLFEMVNRYHDYCPDAVKPATGAANAKELLFAARDSGYKVGTAGTKAVGRSSTVQRLHGSEVGFWPHADEHAAGVLQAVPDIAGTEVILESTANGMGNYFHRQWCDAERGIGDFQTIFVPWYWQEEYRRPVAEDFQLTEEEAEYKGLYKLSDEQIAWRRNKIDAELHDPSLFKQEYPATAAEAFQMSGHDSYIAPELVARARKANITPSGPLVIGYDPAWMGEDRHSMAWRQGRRVTRLVSRSKLSTMEGAGWAKQVIDEYKPARMFIDVGGVGAGVYDRLVEMGYGDGMGKLGTVRAVNFGSAPQEPARVDDNGKQSGGALNRRAEMWMRSRRWLEDEAGAQIPDSDSLQADACGPSYKYDSLTRLQIEKKEDMRRRGVPSPDEWDAVALTFAEPVAPAATSLPRPKAKALGIY
jgi:hypothetical protein